MRIPVYLITGATGAGKSTAIATLLARRPAPERWAVLVNDFGQVSLRGAQGVPEDEVCVREVAGCICCSAQVALRTALVALIRAARPQRLLIEASAAAHPDAIVKLLNEPGLASSIAFVRTVCVVDPRQALDPRHAASDVYRAQVRTADLVVMRTARGISVEERSAARAALEKLDASAIVDDEGLTGLR